MRRWYLAAALLVAVAVTGCGIGSGQPTERLGSPGDDGPPIELNMATLSTLETAVKENKGKVIVMDFWATWCPPCRERFPHLVLMHEKYAAKGLVCISVSLDDPLDRPEVSAFLQRNHATFANFQWNDQTREGNKERDRRFKLGGYIPHVTVFARGGEIAYAGSDKSSNQIEELVKDELGRK